MPRYLALDYLKMVRKLAEVFLMRRQLCNKAVIDLRNLTETESFRFLGFMQSICRIWNRFHETGETFWEMVSFAKPSRGTCWTSRRLSMLYHTRGYSGNFVTMASMGSLWHGLRAFWPVDLKGSSWTVFALVGHLFSLESPRGLYLVRYFSSFT